MLRFKDTPCSGLMLNVTLFSEISDKVIGKQMLETDATRESSIIPFLLALYSAFSFK